MPMYDDPNFDLIYRHAYLPEQLPHYHKTLSDAQPLLIDNHLCAQKNHHMTFIGYALDRSRPTTMYRAYQTAVALLRPHSVTLIGDHTWLPEETESIQALDDYYLLPIPPPRPSPATRYMVRRASREIEISVGDFTTEHQKIIDGSCRMNNLSQANLHRCKLIGKYCHNTPGAIIVYKHKRRWRL